MILKSSVCKKHLNIVHFASSGARIVTEKNSERSELQREHQRGIQNLKKDHKREMDVSQVKTASFLPILWGFFCTTPAYPVCCMFV